MAPSETQAGTGSRRHRNPESWEAKVLTLISEQIAIPMDLLARFLKISHTDATKLMERFAKLDWVELVRFIAADEPWVLLTSAGAKHAGTNFPALRPSLWRLPHRRAVCVVRLKMEEIHPDGRWICERALCSHKSYSHHLPDGLFLVHNQRGELERWAIEAELSAKEKRRYRDLVVNAESYDRVMYFCSPRVASVFSRMPEISDNPRIDYEACLEDPRRQEQFQWVWSKASGPGEMSAYRRAEPQEVEILRLISEQGAVPIDQLARFLGCDYETAQHTADRLDEAGFLIQGRGPADEPPWAWTTKTGGRVAGTEFRAWTPVPVGVARLRLQNEVRLWVSEHAPQTRWRSKRSLRQDAEDASVPMAVVEDDQGLHAIEVEHRRYDQRRLIEIYDRRSRDFQSVAVLCSPGRVGSFNRLKEERGWRNVFVRSFEPSKALPKRPPRKTTRRTARPVQLAETEPDELPIEALEKVQEAEGLATPPGVKLAERYMGSGPRRWRVTTESCQWRVVETRGRWSIRPTSELNERETEPALAKGTKPRRRKPRPATEMKTISTVDLPGKVLETIRKEANLPSLPKARAAKRRTGGGFPRWLVETDVGIWRVTKTYLDGWSARLEADEPARPVQLTEIELDELPIEALEKVQEAEGLATPPVVKLVERYKGSGPSRWRVTTESCQWRVAKSRGRCSIRPTSELNERDTVPGLVKVTKPRGRKPRPATELKTISTADLPAKVLETIRKDANLPTLPEARAAKQRTGGGFPRWLVETDAGIWRVTYTYLNGWSAKPADAG